MEKILFAAPEAEVVRFPVQDIVTTSGVTDNTSAIETPDDEFPNF